MRPANADAGAAAVSMTRKERSLSRRSACAPPLVLGFIVLLFAGWSFVHAGQSMVKPLDISIEAMSRYGPEGADAKTGETESLAF
ncbi:MAG: hypothetical protein QHI48_08225 [Bacteroidota bacterium]|nr:hypothetical protein [Bacteroidota bacterium]